MTRLLITRIWKWFLKEFIHIIPAVIFFFLAFNIINITVALLIKNEAVTYQNFPIILFSAAVVAKVILIADCLYTNYLKNRLFGGIESCR